MVKKGIIQVFFLILISCTPQKRLNRIVRNNPHLLNKDTIRVIDTIVLQNYSVDYTIIVNRFVPVEKVIVKEQTLWEKYGSLAIIVFIGLIAIKAINKYIL